MTVKKYDDLSIRMKQYEKNPEYETDSQTGQPNPNQLKKGLPVMMRLDGKAFHTYTKGMKRPFDERLASAMWETAKFLCENIQGAKLAYTQSDEISIFINSYSNEKTDPWYDNQIQKMTSVSASLATAKFNDIMRDIAPDKGYAFFDSRVWTLPDYEVNNCFIWREQDAIKNSISMVAQANFSHKSLQGLNGIQMKEKLISEKGITWEELPIWQQRGVSIVKVQKPKTVEYNGETITVMRNVWEVDENIPLFTEEREYVNQHVYLTETAEK